jgi:hypothetical protein
MRVLYVSGKYRDSRGPWYVKKNIQRAEDIAVELWKSGFVAICPHLNTAFFEGPIDDPVIIAGDCELVTRCDGLVVCPGWETSAGTRIEWQMAWDKYLPIFYWEKDEDRKAIQLWARDLYDLDAHLQRQQHYHTMEALLERVEDEEGKGPY